MDKFNRTQGAERHMIPAGLPLFGYLRHTRAQDHSSALRELFLAYFFGFFPVWVALLINFLIKGPNNVSAALEYQMDSGAIFLISAAMLSSYVYVLWTGESEPGSTPFPHKTAFGVIFLAMIVSWAIVLGIQGMSNTINTVIQVNSNSLRILTYSSLLLSIICLYLLFVYRSATRPGYAVIARQETEKFTHDWLGRDDNPS